MCAQTDESESAGPTTFLAAVLGQLENQAVIYADRPRRSDLLKLRPHPAPLPLRLNLHRNAPVELLLGPLATFLAAAGLESQTFLGPYDDSLAFSDLPQASLEVVWLDYGRYSAFSSTEALVDWLTERLIHLRETSRAPILVCGSDRDSHFDALLGERLAPLAGVYLVPRMPRVLELGEAYWDSRMLQLGAVPFSNAAMVAQARDLGLMWIPAVLRPRLKVIAVDLDHTLYSGVLGEDGPTGLQFTLAHRALHERLLQLREEGILLALVSRNEPADVAQLFETRKDMPLQLAHFSAMEVSWGPKAEAIARVAESLRVGRDSVLFVDDNAGELASVAAREPEIRLLHARDANHTRRGLEFGPDLLRLREGHEDALRARDLEVSTTRDNLRQEQNDPIAYLHSLQVSLTFSLGPQDQRMRLSELCRKTNQFNLALNRYGESEVEARLADPQWACVTAALQDRLSDSGTVLALFAEHRGDLLVVDELCISCRALGRGLEDILVIEALRGIRSHFPSRRVAFRHATGPRNAPARDWLAHITGIALSGEGLVELNEEPLVLEARIRDLPVTRRWL